MLTISCEDINILKKEFGEQDFCNMPINDLLIMVDDRIVEKGLDLNDKPNEFYYRFQRLYERIYLSN